VAEKVGRQVDVDGASGKMPVTTHDMHDRHNYFVCRIGAEQNRNRPGLVDIVQVGHLPTNYVPGPLIF